MFPDGMISAMCRQARYLYTLSPPAPQGYLEVRTKAEKHLEKARNIRENTFIYDKNG